MSKGTCALFLFISSIAASADSGLSGTDGTVKIVGIDVSYIVSDRGWQWEGHSSNGHAIVSGEKNLLFIFEPKADGARATDIEAVAKQACDEYTSADAQKQRQAASPDQPLSVSTSVVKAFLTQNEHGVTGARYICLLDVKSYQ